MTNRYTKYQSRYFAEQLCLKRASGNIENIMGTLASAKVDLNPHQVDAALFAFASPLSKGVLLADEVGLGKTIEAGIVIAQYFAEHKRNILLIVPASLRNQWLSELDEKFYIKSIILESKNYNAMKKQGVYNPFAQEGKVVICSYNFASSKMQDVARVDWNLAIIDEAHRLRNVYKTNNKIGNNLKTALNGKKKLLLTATPLQNNLMELYGLVSILDDKVFSDVKSFRQKYVYSQDAELRNHFLKEKIAPFCKRTLRKQVTEYVPYTKREAILSEYQPSKEEEELYNKVSAYLQEDMLYALPNSQRKLMTMILRKLLASSSFAIASTLDALVARLEGLIAGIDSDLNLEDYDTIEELLEEADISEDVVIAETLANRELISQELTMVKEYAALAKSIKINAKGENLLTALRNGFERTEQLGGTRKAVIFTESRRTQEYLLNLLSNNGFEGKIVFLNGTNTDAISKEIYKTWLEKHKGEDIVSGSRASDMKAAVVEEFKNNAEILIGTEAAAEGINLQFCSLLVNYDMPWNPQRIEQRIGRCHRYGQKNDVVVLNFVNRSNAADKRVYELLDQKFNLFEGIFGSSDEVLGSIESGVDFESKIAEIYQHCRTQEEIESAFDALQETYKEQIDKTITKTRQALLENFDEDVSKLLKTRNEETIANLNRYEQWLFFFLRSACSGDFEYVEDTRFFFHNHYYNINWKKCEKTSDHFLRKEHYIVEGALREVMATALEKGNVVFDYTSAKRKISFFENLACKSGVLKLQKLVLNGFETSETLIYTAVLDNGMALDDTLVEKLLELPCTETNAVQFKVSEHIEQYALAGKQRILDEMEQKNKKFFLDECAKLDNWGAEMREHIEEELKQLDKDIKALKKDMQANEALYTLEEIVQKRGQLKSLERERARKRATMFEEEDKIEEEVTKLQAEIQKRMKSKTEIEEVFTVRFEVK